MTLDPAFVKQMTADNKKLQDLLDKCDVPSQRRDDLYWLGRNILINNSNPEAFEAHRIIMTMLRREKMTW